MVKDRAGVPPPAVQAVIASVVAGHELILEGCTVQQAGSRQVLRVIVDCLDEQIPSPTLDDIADVSRALSEALDATELANGPAYVLEVSSAGVDRPLTTVPHFRRNLGRLLRISCHSGEEVAGRLLALHGDQAAPDALLLKVAGAKLGTSRERSLPWGEIVKAQVDVEFRHRDGAHPGDDATDDPQPTEAAQSTEGMA